jgi:hypothetical protein
MPQSCTPDKIQVTPAMLEAGFKELETFSSMVDFAPRHQVNDALTKVYLAMEKAKFAGMTAAQGVDTGKAPS